MNLDHTLLRTFIAAVDTLSFTKAASVVHKSPATVSMQIAKLEERLERDLFKQALTSRSCLLRFQGKYYGGFIKTSSYNHEESSSRLLPIRCEFQSAQDLLC